MFCPETKKKIVNQTGRQSRLTYGYMDIPMCLQKSKVPIIYSFKQTVAACDRTEACESSVNTTGEGM